MGRNEGTTERAFEPPIFEIAQGELMSWLHTILPKLGWCDYYGLGAT